MRFGNEEKDFEKALGNSSSRELSEKISKEIEEFLSKGGKIEAIEEPKKSKGTGICWATENRLEEARKNANKASLIARTQRI